VAIHGRTAIQGFTGDADWGPIAEAVRAVRIPVIGNGDIRSPEDAARMFRETRCAGVMIGRAALGNPWIFREVSSFLLDARTHAPPTQHERLETTLEHARLLALHTHGECRPDTPMPGIARGQLLHYLVGMPGVAAARKQMARINCYADVCSIVESLRPFSRLGRSERAWGPTPLAPVPLP
jgi:tRNA-dihydrouridine synthase